MAVYALPIEAQTADPDVMCIPGMLQTAMIHREETRHAIGQAKASAEQCGHGAIVLLSKTNGRAVIVPMKCKLWSCPTCAPYLRWKWIKKIAESKPQRFITLTCDPKRFADPQRAYECMKHALPMLVEMIRSNIGEFEYVAVWEPHKSGWPHLHLAQRGVYVPKKLLLLYWAMVGIGGFTDIKKVGNDKAAATYMAKYLAKHEAYTAAPFKPSRYITSSRHYFPPAPELLPVTTTDLTIVGYSKRHPADIAESLIMTAGMILVLEESTTQLVLQLPQGWPTESLESTIRAVL